MDPQRRHARQSEMRDVRRSAILAAAAALMDREGPDSLTIRAVAAEAGYTPGAVYGYFTGKDELILTLITQNMAALAHRLKQADPNSGPANLRLGALISAGVKALGGTNALALAPGFCTMRACPPDSDLGRVLTGRMIQILQTLSTTLDSQDDKETVLAAAVMIGLAALEGTGRLGLLGLETNELIRHYTDHLSRFNTEPNG